MLNGFLKVIGCHAWLFRPPFSGGLTFLPRLSIKVLCEHQYRSAIYMPCKVETGELSIITVVLDFFLVCLLWCIDTHQNNLNAFLWFRDGQTFKSETGVLKYRFKPQHLQNSPGPHSYCCFQQHCQFDLKACACNKWNNHELGRPSGCWFVHPWI